MAAFTATAAVVLHSLVSIDSDVGLRYAETGQLIQSADYKPQRNEINHTDHRNRRAVKLLNEPVMMVDVTAKVTLLASGMNADAHPGKAFALASFANWYTGVKAGFTGFTAGNGYWIMMAPTVNAPKGDLYEIKYSLELFALADDSVNQVSAL